MEHKGILECMFAFNIGTSGVSAREFHRDSDLQNILLSGS